GEDETIFGKDDFRGRTGKTVEKVCVWFFFFFSFERGHLNVSAFGIPSLLITVICLLTWIC
ncbi:hypothetical protein, partial [Escherichia coli]|uniref:hypothetical protein n=1 Tax=Escherichia coli TaxID=562 RepID=UPI001C59CF4A